TVDDDASPLHHLDLYVRRPGVAKAIAEGRLAGRFEEGNPRQHAGVLELELEGGGGSVLCGGPLSDDQGRDGEGEKGSNGERSQPDTVRALRCPDRRGCTPSPLLRSGCNLARCPWR